MIRHLTGELLTCLIGRASTLKLVPAILLLTAAAGQAAENYAFQFDITLSDRAAAALRDANETIPVEAWYFGLPNEAGREHVEGGFVYLGSESMELPPQTATVRVSGKTFDPSRLAWIEGEIVTAVSVYSSRRSSDDNLITCDTFHEELKTVQSEPPALHCVLNDEL